MLTNNGFYGEFGGQFVPETLIPALDELELAFEEFKERHDLNEELDTLLRNYTGRPTPVFHAANMSARYGLELYLKREDLLHTGAHKINNTIGQSFLTRMMNKKRIIAETGAGQHGVASATAAALFGMECTVFMGSIDAERQSPNVKKMQLLGTRVELVEEGLKTLKDAVSAALKEWVAHCDTTHYLIGSVVGPHPFPAIVAHFQSVIGREARQQCRDRDIVPDCVVACVGGGSNAIGLFQSFLADDVRIVGVEAGGRSLTPGENAASLTGGSRGIFQGSLSYLLQRGQGLVADVHSVSAGLDYPGVGPQHAYLRDAGRVEYTAVSDDQALEAFMELTRREGIIPALESSHAIAWVIQNASSLKGKKILVCLSGRGDKDMEIINQHAGVSL